MGAQTQVLRELGGAQISVLRLWAEPWAELPPGPGGRPDFPSDGRPNGRQTAVLALGCRGLEIWQNLGKIVKKCSKVTFGAISPDPGKSGKNGPPPEKTGPSGTFLARTGLKNPAQIHLENRDFRKAPESCKFPHETLKKCPGEKTGLREISEKTRVFVGVLTAFLPKGSSAWPVICHFGGSN